MNNKNKYFALFFPIVLIFSSCSHQTSSSSNHSSFSIIESSEDLASSEETSSSQESSSEEHSSYSEEVVNHLDFNDWIVGNGLADIESKSINSLENNTIVYSNEISFAEGTYESTMKITDSSSDNGIIFSLDYTNPNFWETSCQYYFFFISRHGTSYLGKVDKTWSLLSEATINDIDLEVEHQLKVIKYHLQDYVLIETYIDNIKYNTYRDYQPLLGKKIGIRSGGKNTIYSNARISTYTGEKEQEMEKYRIANGSFSEENDSYISNVNNSILVSKEHEFEYGTLSVDIKITNAGDNGILFALNENNLKSYWEKGVSYYFFFISNIGTAYLGKAENGNWKALQVVAFPNYSLDRTYNLKVVRDDVSICCYIDDQLYINHLDESPLDGNKVAFRAGSISTIYTNLIIEKTGSYDYIVPEGFKITSGEMLQFKNTIKSKKEKSLIVSEGDLYNGTISVRMSPGSFTNNGIIFRLSEPNTSSYYERVNGLSYYFFHISTNACARLLKFDGTSASVISEIGLSAGYSAGQESLLTVIMKDNNIKCYVDDACFVNYDDPNPLSGTKYGLRASGNGVLFIDFKTNANQEARKADLVLFGHSHAQLYDNCHEELSSVGTIANMGVGGSIIANWDNRVEQITSYQAKYIVCWLGSNDLAASISPETIITKISSLLERIHANQKDAHIILLTEFYQPESFRSTADYHAKIRRINDAYLNDMADYITPIDLFDVPLNSDGSLNENMFRDVFHLTNEAYKKVTERILNTINKEII